MTVLRIGQRAPDFHLQDQDGHTHTLNDHKGQKLVLYFYPRDNTPGCTTQACNLRDNIGALRGKGIAVLGISTDTGKSHKKFEQKFGLSFPLLADPERQMVNDYGVWGDKKFMGRQFQGTHRVTFLIDEAGTIAHIIDDVDKKNRAAQILEVWDL